MYDWEVKENQNGESNYVDFEHELIHCSARHEAELLGGIGALKAAGPWSSCDFSGS